MIKVSGSARRVFTFPADLPTAYAYYSDVGRVLGYLPHIILVRAFSYDQFRMLYSTTELGVYHIHIYCDLQTRLIAHGGNKMIRIGPLVGVPPVKTESSFNSSTAQGVYSSLSVFRAAGGETQVEYSMSLEARLPTPGGLRVMPGAVVDVIAASLAHTRLREIVDGFVECSIEAFPHWLAELQQPRRRRARVA
jgi:hypothetical protein